MIRLNEYIKEELENDIQPINESLILYGLLTAVLVHFGIRVGKKVTNAVKNFWDWVCDDKRIDVTMKTPNESLISYTNNINEVKKEINFDKSKAQPALIDTEETFEKVLQAVKIVSKRKKGFYIFDDLLKDQPELKKINKAPYFPNYALFLDAGDKDNENKRPNFYGIVGFSLKYWKVMSKKSKDQKLKEQASNYKNYINIFAVQTEPKYAKQGLFEVYIESMKKAVKEAKMEGLTIKGDNEDLNKIYEKYGFKKCDDLEGYMALTLKEKDEDK